MKRALAYVKEHFATWYFYACVAYIVYDFLTLYEGDTQRQFLLIMGVGLSYLVVLWIVHNKLWDHDD